jgi:hypothetical protein
MAEFAAAHVKQIIQAGTSLDFEAFCVRHYSKIDGLRYFPTSRTYDAKVDGETETETSLRSGRAYIIASLQEQQIKKKAIADVKGFIRKNYSRVGKIRICLGKLESNTTKNEIEKEAKQLIPNKPIVVSVIPRLVDEVLHNSEAFTEVYRHLLEDAQRVFASVDREPTARATRNGLRVLLATQLEGNAIELRTNILKGLILESTSPDHSLTEDELRRTISETIGLGRLPHESYLQESLRSLRNSGLIEYLPNKSIRRHRAADDLLHDIHNRAMTKIIDGCGLLKKALEVRIQTNIPSRDYTKIWEDVRSGLVELFQRYGTEMVEFVYGWADLAVSGTPAVPMVLGDGLRKIGESLERLTLSLPENEQKKLAQSLPEALLDEQLGTRRWISQLCLSYLCACSLGLHPDALRRLEVQLKTWDLIPDTHVILSMLGKGEADHPGIEKLMQWWRESNGRLILIDSVLGETYRHALLAERQIESWARTYNRYRDGVPASPPDGNAFVRSAIAIQRRPTPMGCSKYLSQFVSPDGNTGKLKQIVEQDFGFVGGPALPRESQLEKLFFDEIRRIRTNERENANNPENVDARCSFDAQTLGYLSAYRKYLSQNTEGRIAVILTESSVVRRVSQNHQNIFGTWSTCLDPAKLLFALALSPRVPFGLNSIASVLFGAAFQSHVVINEDLATKVAEKLASKEDEVLYNSTLQRAVQDKLLQ